MSNGIVDRTLARVLGWAEKFAADEWPRPGAAAIVAGTGAVTAHTVVSWLPAVRGTVAELIVPAAVVVATAAAAGVTAWRRRIPPGCVGVLVALLPETDAQEERLRHDFLLSLRRLLVQGGGTTPFKLVTVPRPTARRLCEDATQALPYLQRRGGHILVFGSVHAVAGRGPHAADQVLVLGASISHAPIPTNIYGALAGDVDDVLPHRVRIRGDEAFFQFEAASDWLDVGVRHVVGFAAALTHDYARAEALLLEVEGRLPTVAQRSPRDPALRRMVKRFPTRLALLYRWWLSDLTHEYLRTRDAALATQMDVVADRLLVRVPGDYAAYLCKAMCEFVLRADVAAARRYVFACRRAPDQTWRYSAAFLDAYQGRLGRARAEYMRAFDGLKRAPHRGTPAGAPPPALPAGAAGRPSPGSTGDAPAEADTLPVECEEFIHLVLAREPGKGQLHFCAGLINKFAKLDPAAAARDFAAFLQATGPAEFVDERKLAAEWLRKIGTETEHAA